MKKLQRVALGVLAVLCTLGTAHAQVGIGTTTPEPNALLELQSTTQGLLLPRMSAAQLAAFDAVLDALPLAQRQNNRGMVVYVYGASEEKLYSYDGTDFQEVGGSAFAGWTFTGNALAGGEFLGSTNGTPVPFYTNNVERMRIDPAGFVGIGLTNPSQRLTLADGNFLLDNTGTAGQMRFREPSAAGANFTAFQAQAQAADITYTLPAAVNAGGFLTTDAGGNLTWGTVTGTVPTGTANDNTLRWNGTNWVESSVVKSTANGLVVIAPSGDAIATVATGTATGTAGVRGNVPAGIPGENYGVHGSANSTGGLAAGVYGVATNTAATGAGVFGTTASGNAAATGVRATNTGAGPALVAQATTGPAARFTNTYVELTSTVPGPAQLRFREESNGLDYVALRAPNLLAASTTYTLPAADGTNGQVLTTDGAGAMSWSSITGTVASGTAADNTLRWNGTNWVETSVVRSTNNGIAVTSTGNGIISTTSGTGAGTIAVTGTANGGSGSPLFGVYGTTNSNTLAGAGVEGFSSAGAAGVRAINSGAGPGLFAQGSTGPAATFSNTYVELTSTAVGPAQLRFREENSGPDYVAFRAPGVLGASTTYTLPAADGTNGQVLTTNGTGILNWSTPSGGVSAGTVANNTLRWNGTNWVEAGNLTNDGTSVGVSTFTGTYGIDVSNTNSASAGIAAIRGTANGSSPQLAFGIIGETDAFDNNSAGIYGRTTQLGSGVYGFHNSGLLGYGVRGYTSSTTATSAGVYGSSNTAASGVLAEATGTGPALKARSSGGATASFENSYIELTNNNNSPVPLRFQEGSTSGTDYVALQAPGVLGASTTYTLPGADGTNGQVLTTDGTGNMSWSTPSGTVPDGIVPNSTLRWDGTNWVEASTLRVSALDVGILSGSLNALFVETTSTANFTSAILGEASQVTGNVTFGVSGYTRSTMIESAGVMGFSFAGAAGVLAESIGNGPALYARAGTGPAGSFEDNYVELLNTTGTPVAMRFHESNASGNGYVSLAAPTTLPSGNVELTLPNSTGTNGQVLTTDGTGNMSWTTVSGGGSVSAGTTTNNTLRWNGSTWVEAANLRNSGTVVTVAGNVGTPAVNITNSFNNTGAVGLFAEATFVMTQPSYGVRGRTQSTNAVSAGVLGEAAGEGSGVRGENSGGAQGSGVFGNYTGTTAEGYGVWGQTASPVANSAGVVGRATGGGANVTYGVRGTTNSTNALSAGVFGTTATAASGVLGQTTAGSTNATGVWGEATNATTNATYGVRGSTGSTNALGAGVYGTASSDANGVFGQSSGAGAGLLGEAIGNGSAIFGRTLGTGPSGRFQNGWVELTSSTGASTPLRFMEAAGGPDYVAFRAPATLAGITTYTLPAADGTNGQVLTTNGAGNLNWTTVGGGSVAAGTSTNNTLRWNGSSWVETSLLTVSTNNVTITTPNLNALYVETTNTSAGSSAIIGDNSLASASFTYGVAGYSNSNTADGAGVYGQSSSGASGVMGVSLTTAPGVRGRAGSGAAGSFENNYVELVNTTNTPAALRLNEGNSNGGNYVSLAAPTALGANVALTLPNSVGTNGQVLTTDGTGNMSWTTVSGGSVAAGTAANNTLRWNGTNWVEASNLTNDGATVTATNSTGFNVLDVSTTNLSLNGVSAITGRASGGSSFTTYGVTGTTTSTSGSGAGVYGNTSNTGYGVYGRSQASTVNSAGVYGEAVTVTPNATFGIRGFTQSTSSVSAGVQGSTAGAGAGVRGENNGGTGAGVYGYYNGATASAGVLGQNVATVASSAGVRGSATATTPNLTYGVYGTTGSQDQFGAGVYGIGTDGASGVVGETSNSGSGVIGRSNALSSGSAGRFLVENTSNGSSAVVIENAGTGPSLSVYNNSVELRNNDNTALELQFFEAASSGPNYVGLRAPATLGANYSLTLPTTPGINGQLLTTDGAGNLSWSSPSGSSVALGTLGNTTLRWNGSAWTESFNLTNDGTNVAVSANSTLYSLDVTNTNTTVGSIAALRGQATGASTFTTYGVVGTTVGGFGSAGVWGSYTGSGTGYGVRGTTSAVTGASAGVYGESTTGAAAVLAQNSGAGPALYVRGNSTNPGGNAMRVLGLAGMTADIATIDNQSGTPAAATLATFNGFVGIRNNNDAAASLRLYENSGNGLNYVGFRAPALLGSDYLYTLPADFGTNGQVLTTDGAGNLTWAAAGASGWGFNGNALIGTEVLGSTNAQPVRFVVENETVMQYVSAGSGVTPMIVGGSSANVATAGAAGSVIAGGGAAGAPNQVTDQFSTVGGGANNLAGDGSGTVSDAAYATVGGGFGNTAGAPYATVAGGLDNRAPIDNAFVGGGGTNTAGGNYSAIVGGSGNSTNGQAAFVGAGGGNNASGAQSVVVGGSGNITVGDNSFMGGGESNTVASLVAVLGGGASNQISGNATAAVLGGGANNLIRFSSGGILDYSVLVGGTNNSIISDQAGGDVSASFIGGGSLNQIYTNTIAAPYAVISGGEQNIMVSSPYGFIGGGAQNRIDNASENPSSTHNAILGGFSNTIAEGQFTSILGGENLTLGKNSVGYNTGNPADASALSNAAYFGNTDLIIGNTTGSRRSLRLMADNSSASVGSAGNIGIQAPAIVSTSYILTLPATPGTNGQVLTTNGTGVLGWTTPSGGAGWALTGGTALTNSGVGAGQQYFGTPVGNTQPVIFATQGVERMRIANTGSVSINGGTGPNALEVGGSARLTGNVIFNNATNHSISIETSTAAQGRDLLVFAGSTTSFNQNGGNLTMGAGSGTGTGAGGDVNLGGGDSDDGPAGDVFIGGGLNNNSGLPGNVNIQGGAATDGPVGGNITLTAGSANGVGGAKGGLLSLVGGESTNGEGGDVVLLGGYTDNGGIAGSISIRGGDAGNNSGGNVNIYGGSGLGIGTVNLAWNDVSNSPQGSVGIGTNSPGSELSVAGNMTVGAGYASTSGPANGLAVQGNVAIASTTANQTLSVNGSYSGKATLFTTNSSYTVQANDYIIIKTNTGGYLLPNPGVGQLGRVVILRNMSAGAQGVSSVGGLAVFNETGVAITSVTLASHSAMTLACVEVSTGNYFWVVVSRS